MLGLEPEAAAALEFVEGESGDEFDESADELGEYLDDQDFGFDEEEDRMARDAFGGREAKF